MLAVGRWGGHELDTTCMTDNASTPYYTVCRRASLGLHWCVYNHRERRFQLSSTLD